MSDLPRLNDASHPTAYDRAAVTAGIVHLGLGAFHRAHQAPLFDALIAGGDTRWGVTGVAMRSRGVVDSLAAQDGLYSLSIRSDAAEPPKVIGALTSFLVAAEQPDAVTAAIAAPDTHLVTITITEKGYLDHGPASAAGLIAAGLEARRVAGLPPLTILSCDNRTGNGPFARDAVLAAAKAAGLSDEAAGWIADRCAFPSSMVDRITPAATEAMLAESSAALGLRDEAAVWTEPFWQWVVEDDFAGEVPDLASVGVQLVADVAPWEAAKLRLLNGAHSTLAYLGLIRGHRFVHEAIADPCLARIVDSVWQEARTTLDETVVDIDAYCAALRTRFANPALPHALIQIAADGSQKLPPRLLAPMRERAAHGLASPALAIAVTGWMLALATVEGLADPLLATLQPLARAAQPAESTAQVLLGCIAPELIGETALLGEIAVVLDGLRDDAPLPSASDAT